MVTTDSGRADGADSQAAGSTGAASKGAAEGATKGASHGPSNDGTSGPSNGPSSGPSNGRSNDPADDPTNDPTNNSSNDGPVGSVAEETARLIEMLAAGGAWGAAVRGSGSGAAGRSGGHQGARGTPDGDGPDAGEGAPRTQHAGAAQHTCTCGGSTPLACRLCPVCQLISFLSSISPDTIDRAADMVGLAATALRDLAATQRARHATADDAGPDGAAADAGAEGAGTDDERRP